MKKTFFFVLLALAIALAGCQPIAPTDTTEIDQLKEQNQALTLLLLEAQDQNRELQNQVYALSTQVAQKTPEPIPEDFVGLASTILPLLRQKNYTTLATFVHPQAGLRFSPQLFIHTDTDLVFTRDQVADFGTDNSIYTWGTHAAKGDNIQMSVNDYWDVYVIPLVPNQEWVMLAENEYSPSIAIDNFNEVYSLGSYIDILKPGTEEFGNLDWQLLRLIFEQATDGAYYLVGIIHDNWVP
ncbi:MAG: hypothetical protein PHW11_02800 [Anaerolineaceae bacterium]|jgi:hypothetical protein|nr:hypothetical protein [Anaerolineaceae bacterium]MDD4043559.1 hypothetical protein [Anaerolineaceae bacterium]MDD4577610.1 hypothetical protein [Anaerolineaceae bacterium]